jgi:small-conductance mechanosensitive channel
MPLKKIELNEVEANLRQAKESAEAVLGLQNEIEDILAKYSDNSKRYAAGELSKQEFDDLTTSKDQDVRSLNNKVKSNIVVLTSSIDAIRKIASVQEHVDETTEREMSAGIRKGIAHKHKAAPAPKHHKAAKHKAKKK